HFPFHFILRQLANQFPDDASGENGITYSFQVDNFLILLAQGNPHLDGQIGVASGEEDAFLLCRHFDSRQNGNGRSRGDRLGHLGDRIHQGGAGDAELHGKPSSFPYFFEMSKRWNPRPYGRRESYFRGWIHILFIFYYLFLSSSRSNRPCEWCG